MNVALWVVAGVLAAAFADTGSLKLTESNQALSACGMTGWMNAVGELAPPASGATGVAS